MRWIKKGLIFCPDGNYDWNRSHASVPTVDFLSELNILRIYYAARNTENQCSISFIDVDADDPSKIKYIHDAPVLSKGSIGGFDDCGVMPSWMITKDDRKLLYFIGWNVRNTVPYSNALGVAVSYDLGQSFERLYPGAILDRSKEEPLFTSSGCLIEHKGIFYIYYLSCTEFRMIDGKVEPRYHIKFATSVDGIGFDRNGHIAIDFSSDEEAGISRPTVVFNNGFKMWYSYRKFKNYRTDKAASYKIGYAESDSGLDWIRKDEEVGLVADEDQWDSEMQCYPFVIKVKDKTFMFYNGNGFGRSGIGYAIADDID